MKPSTLLLPLSLTLSSLQFTSAQQEQQQKAPQPPQLPHQQLWDQFQSLLNPGSKPSSSTGEKIVPKPGVVYSIGKDDYRDFLQHNDLDWLVLFTTGPDSCPGCVLYESTFNETVALLSENQNIHFGRVDCDAQAVLCSVFGAWGSRVFHITHSNPPSKSFPGLQDHKTHIRPVPFHRPGSPPSPPPIDEKTGEPIKSANPPPPPPDAVWISEVINDKKWVGFSEWDGMSHPFDGALQIPLYQWWWVVGLFSRVPPMAMMVGIGLFSRFVTSKFTGRVYAQRERQQQVAAAAAAGAKKGN
ncbi:hypothetical protein TWF730_006480 [Orbilia blumenaviensis]|uniref:Thioredoxin domain-containing protein n=1 Tax=Orbilia blumenaviensis TaxID=1796055 RepID=A0AAV9VGQ2_9PEZI